MTTPVDPDLGPVLPEQTAVPGEPLPPLPDTAYPPDAAPLDPPPAIEVWTLPNGDTIPQRLALPPIPDVRAEAGWVSFRNPRELRAGDQEDVLAALPDSPNRASAAMALLRASAALLIDGWSFTDLPLPRVALGSMRQLEIADYEAIAEAVSPVMEVLFPNPSVTAAGVPNRPTGPSSS